MRYVPSLSWIGAAAVGVAVGISDVRAEPISAPLGADQVALALKGHLCTTKGGAKFTFTSDGHYAYAGLGRTHSGHYWFVDGAVTVLLDNGLSRDFAISTGQDVLYMEETVIRCAPLKPRSARLSIAR